MRLRASRIGRLLPAVLIAGGATAAFAMSIRESKTPLARSADGATLTEVPEACSSESRAGLVIAK